MHKESRSKLLELTVRRSAGAKKNSVFPTMSSSVGNVQEEEVEEGEGSEVEKLLSNGDFYTGQWSENYPHGNGKYLWTDGCMYEGEWCRGKTMGRGRFTWPSGAAYEGDFKTGFMDGHGMYTGCKGDIYRGCWVMNLKQGKGRNKYSNGDTYDGEWRCGMQDGHGKYRWKNGNEYEGQWKNGVIFGKGSMLWANGNRYVGSWEDGLPKGEGRYLWVDGSFYEGTWSMDPSEQNGTYHPSDNASPANQDWDPQEVFNVNLKDCIICPGEKIAVLPSQKTLNWIGVEMDFSQKQARDGDEASLWLSDVDARRLRIQQIRLQTKEMKKQGVTISKGHKNYELMLNLQLGIRYSCIRLC